MNRFFHHAFERSWNISIILKGPLDENFMEVSKKGEKILTVVKDEYVFFENE